MHYENSTRKLVNILESLSSQLTGPCVTRHCPDTDSFDSVLSRSVMILIFDIMKHEAITLRRRSSGQSSLLRETTSISSQVTREEAGTSPSYENLFFDSSLAAGSEVTGARPYRRHDSLHSVLPPQNRSR